MTPKQYNPHLNIKKQAINPGKNHYICRHKYMKNNISSKFKINFPDKNKIRCVDLRSSACH